MAQIFMNPNVMIAIDPLLSQLLPHQMRQSEPIKVTKSRITDNTNRLPTTELNSKYANLS